MLKVFLRLAGGLLGLVILAVVALFAVNATDVPLSEEAQALLRQSAPPLPSERNGFIDFLALGAPAEAPTFATGVAQLAVLNKQADGQLLDVAIDPRARQCRYNEILSCISRDPLLKQVVASHAVLLARYRAMREKPEFVDLQVRTSPEEPLLAYLPLTSGNRLLLTQAALEFHAGRRARALDELEAEFRFHRTMAAGSRSLIAKMIAFAMLGGDALFAADLARNMPARDRAQWARLQALLHAPTKAELDLSDVLKQENAQIAEWMSTRKYVRMSDAVYESIKSFNPEFKRPWWDPLAPWLYRPHYSVNRYVAQSNLMLAVAERPASQFLAAQKEQQARVQELDQPVWKPLVLSPAGTFSWVFSEGYSDYIGRAHAVAAMFELTALQVDLRAAGITRPADVTRAVAGPRGRAHLNPFTDQPMEFDAEKMTLGFACTLKLLPGTLRLIAADGRVALPL